MRASEDKLEKGRIIFKLTRSIRIPEENENFRRYTQSTSSDVFNEIAQAYVEWARSKQGWMYEAFEGAFKLGRKLSSQYNLSAQRIESLFNDVLAKFGGIIGFFISGFLRNLDDFSIRLKVRSASGIGFRMKGGRLYVEGKTSFLGMEMEDGEIVTPLAGNYLGKGMRGGRIVAGTAGDWVGMEMKGGKIVVKKAGNALGFGMEGGEIIAREAGAWVGESSKGGKIIVGRCESVGSGKAFITVDEVQFRSQAGAAL